MEKDTNARPYTADRAKVPNTRGQRRQYQHDDLEETEQQGQNALIHALAEKDAKIAQLTALVQFLADEVRIYTKTYEAELASSQSK